MKHTILVLAILVGILANAQRTGGGFRGKTYPLNHRKDIIENYSYFRDVDNTLFPYVGTWKYTYNGRQIILIISKEERVFTEDNFNKKKYYTDRLIGRYEVRDSSGKVLETTLQNDFKNKDLMIQGRIFEPETSKLMMIFYGGKCGIGNGFIRLSKSSNNQLSWTYFPQYILVTERNENECKGDVYLPQGENLIFTKQ